MEIDKKTIKKLTDEGRIAHAKLRVVDAGMNVALVVHPEGAEAPATLHAKRGGVRVMSAQTGLRFAQDVLGSREITVELLDDDK